MIDIAAPREVEEWRGASSDTPVPPRVRLRVYLRDKGVCRECGRKLGPADKPECDHIVAICNGGQNRERNLRTLCNWCHAAKSRKDVAEKSRTAHVLSKHVGIKRASTRPMPGSRASGIRKRMNGTVERWGGR